MSGRHTTNSFHRSVAVTVCRSNTSARKMEKVRPQPPRRPRLEQKTRCPRTVWPSGWAGSLPKRRLCRFSVSHCPQRGQRCCLSEKAASEVPERRGQTEMCNEPRGLLLPEPRGAVENFTTALEGGATRFREVWKRGRTALTAQTALHHAEIVITLPVTRSLRPKNGTSYDGTAARNI